MSKCGFCGVEDDSIDRALKLKDDEIQRLLEFVSACQFATEGGVSKLRDEANDLFRLSQRSKS